MVDINGGSHAVVRASAEQRYKEELERLRADDKAKRPEGWLLSPRAVRSFILGDKERGISRKDLERFLELSGDDFHQTG